MFRVYSLLSLASKHHPLLRSPVPEAFVVVQSLSRVRLPLHGMQHPRLPCPSLSPKVCSNSCPLSRWCHPYNHVILCLPFLPPSILPSIRVFSSESALCTRWPKYWNFSFSNSPSNKHSALISFKIDWFDLLAVQGTLKSLLQNNLKTSLVS